MSTEDGALLAQGLAALQLAVPDSGIDQLLRYQALMAKWNGPFNLVSDGELNEFIPRHLLDSLAIADELVSAQQILDIGSGGGLPGIPLAIVHPDKRFVLLDSNGKKTRFLFQAVLALGLDNVQVENCRVEHYQSPRQIDIVTCRAFSSLAEMLEKSQQCFHEDTVLLAMKGRFPDAEIAQLPSGFRVVATRKLSIPGNDSERHLITVKMQASAAG